MNQKWKEMKAFSKTLLVIRLMVSLLVIFFAVLQLTKVWERANHVAIPLVGVVFLVQGMGEWKSSRRRSVFSFFTCFVILCFSLGVWFL